MPKQEKLTSRLVESQENLPYVEKDVIRVITHRIRKPDEIVSPLLPTHAALTQAYRRAQTRAQSSQDQSTLVDSADDILFDKLLNPADAFLTASDWMAKGIKALNRGQIIPPGGVVTEINDKGKDRSETPYETITRKLSTESHIFGIREDKLKKIAAQTYDFIHDGDPQNIHRRNTNLSLYETEVPHFTVPFAYDPADKAERMETITLRDLAQLFSPDERLKNRRDGQRDLALLDSLSLSVERRREFDVRAADEKEIIQVRGAITRSMLAYEIEIRKEVVRRLLDITTHDERERLLKVWSEIDRSPVKTVADAETFFMLYKNILSDYEHSISDWQANEYLGDPDDSVSELESMGAALSVNTGSGLYEPSLEKMRKRTVLVNELQRALESVVFERSLQFIENAGPQRDFLAGQLFLKLTRPTNYEFRLLFSKYHGLRRIIGAICEAFEIDPHKDSDWYTKTIGRLIQAKGIAGVSRQKTSPESKTPSQKQSVRERLRKNLAKALEIPENYFEAALAEAIGLEDYIVKPLRKVVKPEVLRMMFPHTAYARSVDALDLAAQIFGAYNRETFSPFPPFEARWFALKTLLEARSWVQAKELYGQLSTKPFKLFVDAFDQMAKRIPNKEQDARRFDERYQLFPPKKIMEEVTVMVQQQPIVFDVSDMPVEILSRFSLKDFDSFFRKYLEGWGEPKYLIQDMFRRFITIDTDSFMRSFLHKFQNEDVGVAQAVTRSWAREVAKYILHEYESYVKSVLNSPQYQPTKSRATGIFQGVFPHDISRGSPASYPVDDWIKVVQEASGFQDGQLISYQEELQIGTIESVDAKALDDEEQYAVRRLFVAHHKEYWPLLYVLYGILLAYEQAIKQQYESGEVVFPRGLT